MCVYQSFSVMVIALNVKGRVEVKLLDSGEEFYVIEGGGAGWRPPELQ